MSRLHINNDEFLPLPTIPIAGETREEVADQVALGFQILGAASSKNPSKIYNTVNQYLSDSVDHNKSVGEDVPAILGLDKKTDQTFCVTHTNLGLCRAINTQLSKMETELGIDNLLDGFLSTIEYDSKNGSLTGQFIDCVTRFASKNLNKPWNRSGDYQGFCNKIKVEYHMFLYKDERFGCFPKASGVVLYSMETLSEFLMENPDIDNRLACIVRDILKQQYLPACFGIQITQVNKINFFCPETKPLVSI